MSEERWCSCSLMNLFVIIACLKKICLTCANKLKMIVSVLLHMVNHTDPSQSVKSFKTASKHFFSTMSEVKSLVPLVDVMLIKGLLVGMTGLSGASTRSLSRRSLTAFLFVCCRLQSWRILLFGVLNLLCTGCLLMWCSSTNSMGEHTHTHTLGVSDVNRQRYLSTHRKHRLTHRHTHTNTGRIVSPQGVRLIPMLLCACV